MLEELDELETLLSRSRATRPVPKSDAFELVCAYCGSSCEENEGEAAFCPGCGGRMCPYCQSEATIEGHPKVCPTCANPLPPGGTLARPGLPPIES